VLVADCGGSTGWGHFTRSHALAAELAARGADVTLGVCGSPPPIVADVPVVALARSERNRFVCHAASGSDLVVVDLSDVKDFVPPAAGGRAMLAWISDRSRPGFQADIGIDPTLSTTRDRVRDDGRSVFQGAGYIILRQQFDCPGRRVCAFQVRRVLVGFGGTGQATVTRRVLSALKRAGLTIEEIAIVAGESRESAPGFPGAPKVRVLSGVGDMRSLYEWADLCVLAGGTMLFEACVTGLPSIVVSLNENQALDAAYLARHRAVVHLGPATELSEAAVTTAVRSCGDCKRRQRLAQSAQALIDANGRARVAQSLLAAIENARRGAVA
jgi:spore coat polysaccharide biosynthesis predicted glycosyltransferase SpsG